MTLIGNMLQEVTVLPKSVDDYIPILGVERINQLKKEAAPLKGKKVLHLNATAFGGGVAELLKTQVAIMNDLGIDTHWYTMSAKQDFFEVTKMFHNTMQGQSGTLSEDQKEIYLTTVEKNAKAMVEKFDYLIIHDPQPLPLLNYVTAPSGKWIWRCHIDTSTPNNEIWNFLYPYMQSYDACIFTLDEFVKEGADLKNLTFIPPSIDPLSPKNNEMSQEEINNLVLSYNIDINRPLMTQVSRFDPWKDPLGVIEVYRNLKFNDGLGNLQLALIGSMADDDPEGWTIYDRVMRRAGEDFDLKVYTNFHNVGDVGVKAFQYASDVILQKSLKEGFGLTVAEALWKGKPVVGGNVGGIKMQIQDGVNGFLVSSIKEATEKTGYLLHNPEEAKKMGAKGKEIVRDNFTSIREVEDHLKLFNKLSK